MSPSPVHRAIKATTSRYNRDDEAGATSFVVVVVVGGFVVVGVVVVVVVGGVKVVERARARLDGAAESGLICANLTNVANVANVVNRRDEGDP